jgi:hypothetical protein
MAVHYVTWLCTERGEVRRVKLSLWLLVIRNDVVHF